MLLDDIGFFWKAPFTQQRPPKSERLNQQKEYDAKRAALGALADEEATVGDEEATARVDNPDDPVPTAVEADADASNDDISTNEGGALNSVRECFMMALLFTMFTNKSLSICYCMP